MAGSMSCLRWMIGGIMAVAVAACGGGSEQTAGPVVRDSAGIQIVENLERAPGWSEDSAWRLGSEPIVSIGSIDADSTQLLHQVRDSRVLDDGRIALVNGGSNEVRLYSPEGTLLQTIGRSGDGPGEFRSAWRVYPLANDSLLVIDLYRAANVFDPAGTYVRKFPMLPPGGEAIGHGLAPVDQFGDGTLLMRSHYPEDPSWTGVKRNLVQMVRVPLTGEPGSSLGDFEDQTVYYGADGVVAFGPWAKEAASGSSMWYGPGDRFELVEVGSDGATRRIVRFDRAGRIVTSQDQASYTEASLAQFEGTPAEAFMRRRLEGVQFPERFPAHHELMTDPLGNLWVQDYRPWEYEAELPRTWTVFDSTGAYQGDVTFPANFGLQYIGADRVTGVWQNELGVQFVHVYEIEKPLS